MTSRELAEQAPAQASPPGGALGGLADRLRPHAWPAVTGLLLGLLALGPALARGFVLSYDMVFVPSPPIGYADLGLGGGPPRAVPSDLIVALAARVVPAELVQKLILIAIFVLACSGAAALLATGWRKRSGGARLELLPQLVAGACYTWNPFVAERLIMGQWAFLLGYAGLPWVVREICRNPERVSLGRLAVAMVPAAVGGFTAMSITVLAALPAAVLGPSRARRARTILATLAVLTAASLPWLVPSLMYPVTSDPIGAAAFAARADTPFGALGSLLQLSGIWNAQAVPAGYGGLPTSVVWLTVMVIAAAGYLVTARRRRISPGLGVAAVFGLAIAALGLTRPTLSALQAAITAWPGFAVLRDGQQFIAPLALVTAVGLGAGLGALLLRASAEQPAAAAERADQAGRARKPAKGPAITLGVLALIAPVFVLPGLAWGAANRLQAVTYPADWLRARQLIDGDPRAGSVLLLPWAQYRRYPWNHGEAVYDPWPRLLARTMIWNDALQVGRLTVATESARARALNSAITSGGPLTAALTSAGVRYVVVDSGPLLGHQRRGLPERARLPGARVVLSSADLVVFVLRSGTGQHVSGS